MGLAHTSGRGPCIMAPGTHASSLNCRGQSNRSWVKSVKRAARLPLQVGHKGSELAACLPRGQLAGWRGLPIPAPHPGPASLSQSYVTSHDDCHGRHTDRVCQGASSLELRVKMRLRQR